VYDKLLKHRNPDSHFEQPYIYIYIYILCQDHNINTCERSALYNIAESISHIHIELHLSGLIGTARHADIQKIGIIGFFFENRLHW